MAKTRVTIALGGKHLEVLDKIADASHKKRGTILTEMAEEMLDGLIPALEAESEGQAWKALFRTSLNKISELLDETE